MRTRKAQIRVRTPVFLGCEGESEQAYGQFLYEIVRQRDLPIHIEVVNLNPGAGDPLSRVKRAVKEIARRSQRRAEFAYRAILMDDDQIVGDVRLQRQVERLATQNRISIIWQSPCHEAFLLRHFDGRLNAKPPDTVGSASSLRQVWPDYVKPASRREISQRLDFPSVERVAGQNRELAELLRFLDLIG